MPADLQPMAVAARSPGDYAPVAGVAAVTALRDAAGALADARILHVSAAGSAGSVPRLLGGLLALEAGAGLDVEWRVLFADPRLRRVSDALHSGLRGGETGLDDADWRGYREACEGLAAGLVDFDVVILHDPGTLALADPLPGKAIWRCHIDASTPDPEALERATGLARGCDLVLVPDLGLLPEPLRDERARAAPPGIDPLDARNLELEARVPGRVVRPLGVDLERPFCLQVLALDGWDDPHSAIDVFRVAKGAVPGLQLVLAARLESEAAGEWPAAKEVSDYARGVEDVLLLTSYEGLGSLELGALQRLARVALEQSIRAGFGLTACEALWKWTPVIGSGGDGLALCVRDGVDGFLIDDVEAAGERLAELVRDPGLAAEMGRAGHAGVAERFLLTAAAERELQAIAEAV